MTSPFFSICIPQYGRTDFLLEAIDGISNQRFRDLELCISDDKSPDGRQGQIIEALNHSDLTFTFQIQNENCGYDANLRTAIAMAKGKYCFLLGNDDTFVDEFALGHFHDLIGRYGPCGVVISNYQDYLTGTKVSRVHSTGNRGCGPDIAVKHFRNFSFVSGVILERLAAQAFATERWDGSEMYQTFIGCRIIANGGSLVEINESLIRKDIKLLNQSVESLATRPRIRPCPIVERKIPLVQLGRLTADAVRPYGSGIEQRRRNAGILLQLLRYTYPFWLFEFRRIQSWPYAAGIALGMRPRRIAAGVELTKAGALLVYFWYTTVSFVGLLAPLWLFDFARPVLYRVAKRT